MTLLHGLVYAAALIFVVAVVARGLRIARTPLHLRWELYPVPHEKGRARHGGSRMEEVDWWTKSMAKDHFGELGVMIPEILLLKGVWEHNRGLWFGSWALHFGLYLLIGAMVLGLLGGILAAAGVSLASGFGLLVLVVLKVVALVGAVLGTIGALVMLYKRLFDRKMAAYATASHYWNILHLGAIYVAGLIWFLGDPDFAATVAALYEGLVTGSAVPELPAAAWVHVAAVLLFVVYLPFTHMTHFFTKYFTYHNVRWEDAPNKPGSRLEAKIKEAVSQPVSWAAPHVGADGKKTWADLVAGTGAVAKEEEKD